MRLADFIRRQLVVLGVLALGAGAAISATTTLTYQVSTSADDGYAWSAAGQNTTAGYLLIGDDDFSAPYFMSAMRFNNVAVPRSAAIIDARLKISSTTEEYRGRIYGVIQAEAADNAADFSSRYIGSAVKTAAAVNWDHKFAWGTNTHYTSGDISSIVQEVTDRPGWSSGNSAVVFYSTRTDSGKSRRFGSVDLGASYAAVLVVTYQTYTISGHVTTSGGSGLSGVAVSAGVDIESTVTDSSGYYQLQIPPGWSGTVTADKPDCGFVPASRPYSNVTSNQTAQDYTAFQPIISGHITEDGAGVAGVTVSADNGGGSDATDAAGYYEVTVPYDWSGTVTATKVGWGFTPANRSYSNVVADETNQNFTTFQPVISGRITEDGGAAVAGAIVSANNSGGSDTTDATGYYEVTVPYDWSGTVTATKVGWGFTPANRSYSNVVADETNQNFTAFQPVISGHITGDGGASVEGVTVSADTGGGSDVTDAAGYYEIAVPYDWSGTVTAIKTALGFDPTERTYVTLITDQTNQDYASYALYGGGSGTDVDPYLIYIAEQMQAIGSNPVDWDRHFKLMADIDLNIYDGLNGNDSFKMIGTDLNGPFAGTFDGNGYTISNFHYFADQDKSNGLFGRIVGSGNYTNIKNLTLIDPYIEADYDQNVGVLVGNLQSGIISDCYIQNGEVIGNADSFTGVGGLTGRSDATITNCHFEGTVTSAGHHAGGLVGNAWSGTISLSSAKADVYADEQAGGLIGDIVGVSVVDCHANSHVTAASWMAGGLVASTYGNSTIKRCYATGSVSDAHKIGGLIGSVNNSIVKNSYSFTNVSTSGDYAGGLIGYTQQSTVTKCFAAGNVSSTGNYIGGLAGYDFDSIYSACLWDTETSGQPAGVGNKTISEVRGKTTQEMMSEATFTSYNWNFTDVWAICDGYGYPYLRWEGFPPCIDISNNTLAFAAISKEVNPEDQTFTIVNSFEGILNWSIDKPVECDWLNVSPLSNNSNPDVNEVTVSINISGLDYGSYNCQLTVSDPNATNSPQVVTVNLEMLRPVLSVSPPSFDFLAQKGDPNVPEQILYIQNTGYDTLNWQVEIPPDCGWLSATPGVGQSSGEVDEVVLSIDTSGLDNAGYYCELTVTDPNADNSPRAVHVWLHVFTPGEIHVPAEYPTIQAGINAALEGDHVIVHPGVYTGPGNHDIDFRGKEITVRSIDPADPNIVANTIVDLQDADYGIAFVIHGRNYPYEDYHPTLDGLTIANCSGWTAISIRYGRPTIRNCVIRDNFNNYGIWRRGSIAIFCEQSSAVISNCVISNIGGGFGSNYGGGGGAIILENWELGILPTVIISNCIISNNQFYGGAGIVCDGVKATINNCTIVANVAISDDDWGWGWDIGINFGAGIIVESGDVTINDCILWDNIADDGPQITILDWKDDWYGRMPRSRVTVSYSDVQGGESDVLIIPDPWVYFETGYIDPNAIDPNTLTWGPGNIDVDPMFVRDANDGGDGWFDDLETEDVDESANNIYGDYHLMPDSPCIDAGDPNYAEDPNETDIDGQARIVGGRIDMGADELQLQVILDLDGLWMYQNLPGSTNSNLIATVSITDDPLANSSYTYQWEFILPDDARQPPIITDGGGPTDAFCTFAAPNCNEPNGLSDSGQVFTVRVTVTGDDYDNTAQAQARFGIALLGDVNNDTVENVADRSIINAFWRTGSAGIFTLKDCDLNSDGTVNVADRSIANAIWRGALGQSSVSSPCPYR